MSEIGCEGSHGGGELARRRAQGMKIRVASRFWDRVRGLMFSKGMAPDEGLLIERCNAIHTCFMRFPIDATFLDADGNVVKTVRRIKPWRLCVFGGLRASSVLEEMTNK